MSDLLCGAAVMPDSVCDKCPDSVKCLQGLVSVGDGRPGRYEGVPVLDLSGFHRDNMPSVDSVLEVLGEMTGCEAS